MNTNWGSLIPDFCDDPENFQWIIKIIISRANNMVFQISPARAKTRKQGGKFVHTFISDSCGFSLHKSLLHITKLLV